MTVITLTTHDRATSAAAQVAKEMTLLSPSIMDKRVFFTQMSSYLVASILGTALHYLVLFLLVNSFALHSVIASTCGAASGAIMIYVLNYFLVFKCDRRHRDALTRFLLVASLGVLLNGIILSYLTKALNWHYLVLQVVTTVLVFASNFAINRNWTFSSATRSR